MVLLEYPAGATAPEHFHPIAGPNYVVSGTVSSQWEGDEKLEIFKAGDSFIDHADKVHRVKNASQTEGFALVACYVVKIGDPNVVIV